MTLLRGFPDMSPEADAGEHELHYALYPHMTVAQNIAFQARLSGRHDPDHCTMLAERLGIDEIHAMFFQI